MKKQLKINLTELIIIIAAMILIICTVVVVNVLGSNNYIELERITAEELQAENDNNKTIAEANAKKKLEEEQERIENNKRIEKYDYSINSKDIEDFTYLFLKTNNQKKNNVYSPWAIANRSKYSWMLDTDYEYININLDDLEWEDNFTKDSKKIYSAIFMHEKRAINENDDTSLMSIDIPNVDRYTVKSYYNGFEDDTAWCYDFEASINNYNVVGEYGEEKIKRIVSGEYKKAANREEFDYNHTFINGFATYERTDAIIERELNEFLPQYIDELNDNYRKVGYTTEFSMYIDEDVKIFAKNLKEVQNTKLQYIAIMPREIELQEFVNGINTSKINEYISDLKELKSENFKEGVFTRITGYIPNPFIDESIDLEEDLKKIGMTSGEIENKQQIRLEINENQDNVSDYEEVELVPYYETLTFDYRFDVKIEEIDLTIDKPFLFLIRDIENNEIVFVGTKYTSV